MEPRVLSIQSHVVFGYVGNKSAVFPLQTLGFDVDAINSVQFSNHTGYPNGFKGEVMDGDKLLTIVEGLESNGLLNNKHTHLLTGYIGSASFLSAVLQIINKLKTTSPDFKYVCDPVLGDNGKLYVPEELVEIYKKDVLKLAYMVTPNSFECEKLTGITITDMASATTACEALHALGPTVVVITSMHFEDEDGKLTIMVSDKSLPETARWAVTFDRIEGHYTGTGDLTAALLLAWDHNTSDESPQFPKWKVVLEKVANTMKKVIKKTFETNPGGELRLVQSRKDIEGGGGWESGTINARPIT
ncbi:hypothetical protein TrST_g3824 [Triparma strigata]|uniref:pyridoxal kinase n=1 Tax=Triparma strigata TaxID=1606541 RepID=A0A9W7EV82_9STRA|nr:hypothetical protein TrST_g3824 [Triparma strigata]